MQHRNNLRRLLTGLVSLWLLAGMAAASAEERRTGSNFDHFATGFPLTGAHAQAECQTCHLQGVFKGTPRQCEVCHTQGSRIASTFKPSNHPRTAMPCSQCHTSQTTWTGARFDHVGVTPGSCITCHNGVTATGKPSGGGHPTTTAACDSCHRTTAWLPASWDHTGVVAGTCGTLCHNGTAAMGMNAGHIPIGSIPAGTSCDACHSYTAASFSYTTFTRYTHNVAHGVQANQCTTCHNGAYTSANASGKNAKHLPTAIDCDICHDAPQFKPAQFTHDVTHGVVAGQCQTCHIGGYSGVPTKPSDHPNTGNTSCDQCHTSTTSWGPGVNRAPLPLRTPLRTSPPGRVPPPRK